MGKSCKTKGVFKESDFVSGDGMLTGVWGPSLWHTLHTISFNYPVKPSSEDKKNYYNFIMSLRHILPCIYCRQNFVKNIKAIKFSMKSMKSRETFSRAIYDLHEEVNCVLGKKSGLTYEKVRDRYEIFRARCLNNKKTVKKVKGKKAPKEKGCTDPLYGVKSKCVINIVPKTKKCNTFNIEDKCIPRRG